MNSFQFPDFLLVSALTLAIGISATTDVTAQDAGIATPQTLSGAYTGKVYSPYAQRNFPERPLWGDSHLHTALSMDAGLFGNHLPPRDAYTIGSLAAYWTIERVANLAPA